MVEFTPNAQLVLDQFPLAGILFPSNSQKFNTDITVDKNVLGIDSRLIAN